MLLTISTKVVPIPQLYRNQTFHSKSEVYCKFHISAFNNCIMRLFKGHGTYIHMKPMVNLYIHWQILYVQ